VDDPRAGRKRTLSVGEACAYPSDVTCKPRLAKSPDLPSWLELVSEAEDLFGPMPDFEVHARRGIHRGTALVVADGEQVHGAALLSRDGRPQHIRWLAVRGSARGRGVGAALLAAILDRWSTDDVEVVTFTQGTTGGEAARRLYERFGFQCVGATDAAPDGGRRDLYSLRR